MGEDIKIKPVKVVIAIPNAGYTQVESYENRLVNFLYLGGLQEQCRFLRHIMKQVGLGVITSDQANAVLKSYQEEQPISLFVSNNQIEFYFFVVGRLFTPLAREEAAIKALEAEADYLLMMDDDMICMNDLFEKLYSHKKDIVGALAFTRNPPHKPVIYSCIEGWDQVARKPYFRNHYVWNYPKDKLVQCDAIGFGCVLIDMKVFKAIPRPWFAMCSDTGEDIQFCYKAKAAGFKVFMDTSCKTGHLSKPEIVTEDSARKYWETHEMEIEKHNGEYFKYEKEVKAVAI